MTRAIYPKVWKCYNSWCSPKGHQMKKIVLVLEFLHQGMEKGLAISNIKTQVAALSVFLEKILSREPLIFRFFRALARNRPASLKVFPKLDLSFLLQGLTKGQFEPLEEASFKFLLLKQFF